MPAGRGEKRFPKPDAVVLVAQPQTVGGRLTKARAKRYCVRRLEIDRALFDAIDPVGRDGSSMSPAQAVMGGAARRHAMRIRHVSRGDRRDTLPPQWSP